jgi:hypothetical protein
MARPNKISPLKDRPLRNPGQSLEAQLDDLRDRKILLPILTAGVLILLAGLEWFRWYRDTPPQPAIYSLFAIGYAIYVVVTIRRSWAHMQAIKLGRDGERAVGQYLDQLRESGSRVFHDIVGQGFNVDHVVVAAQGIFVVETKTWRKPARGEAHISFDGTSIRADGIHPNVIRYSRCSRRRRGCAIFSGRAPVRHSRSNRLSCFQDGLWKAPRRPKQRSAAYGFSTRRRCQALSQPSLRYAESRT